MAISPSFLAQNSKVGRLLKTRDHDIFKNGLNVKKLSTYSWIYKDAKLSFPNNFGKYYLGT